MGARDMGIPFFSPQSCHFPPRDQNAKRPAVHPGGASRWRRIVERSVIQRPIAELRRGDLGAPVAVAAMLAQRVGEVRPERARRVDRDGEARDDAPLRGLIPTKARSGNYADELDDMAAAPDLDPVQDQVRDDQRFADGDFGVGGSEAHGHALQSQPTALNTSAARVEAGGSRLVAFSDIGEALPAHAGEHRRPQQCLGDPATVVGNATAIDFDDIFEGRAQSRQGRRRRREKCL